MDPHHYLHLPDAKVDIRGSQIAVLSKFVIDGQKSSALVFNFMDGRWSRSVEEPQHRLQESSEHASRLHLADDPFFIHSIYYSSSLRWWMNVLSSINDQLIAYVGACGSQSAEASTKHYDAVPHTDIRQEKRLQEEIDGEGQASNTYSVVNRALHSIAAHLHRYGSELTSTQDSLTDISTYHEGFKKSRPAERQESFQRVSLCFDQIASQVKQVKAFLQELEVKLQNILALVWSLFLGSRMIEHWKSSPSHELADQC